MKVKREHMMVAVHDSKLASQVCMRCTLCYREMNK